MKRNTWFFYVALLLPMIAIPLWTGVSHGAIKTSDLQVNNHNNQKILAKVSTLRIPFVSNEGQVAKEVGFYAKTFGGTVYVTQKGEMVYALTQKEKDQSLMKRVKDGKGRNIRVCVLKERLLKAKNSRLQGQEKAVTKVNYFIGGKDNWKTNIPSFNIVSYGQVYDNIELTLRAHTNNVEKIFTVHPKGRVEDIRLVVDGAVSLKLNPAGELEIDTGSGTFNFSVPIAFQEIEGERKNVQVAYAVKNNTYGFKVGQYDHNFPLIIDPTLTYSTYLGGTNFEEGYDITVDGNGNAYITGVTTSSDFPTQGPYDGTLDGQDAFVAKLDAMGDTLIYSTYLGGTSAEFGYGIGVDTSGNAYVTGGTYSGNFPTTAGAFQTSHSDTAYIEAFVTKLSPDGTALVYSTFLGGLDMDDSWCISVDSSGNAYVTGYTSSSDFPIAGSPYQGVKPSGVGIADAFAAKINSDGSALAYSTYLGGGAADRGNTIHADGSGNAYITGSTLSSNFPTTTGAYQESHANTGSEDAFITKLNSTGGGLYSTFLGGTSADEGKGLVVDSGGIIHVTGYTDSNNFPTAGNPYSNTHAGGRDVFVTKFDPTGAGVDDLIYSTFLGGSSAETGNAIELDNFGNVYITGDTIS
ncbi:MAG: SBBP repeat-containing protein, partial [Desulfobacterales bacterium]